MVTAPPPLTPADNEPSATPEVDEEDETLL